MAKFKKDGGRATPAINTSALPDIVFMLLFFFMVATKMRDKEMKVKTQLPTATEVEKLEKKSRLHYIFVGPPLNPEFGTSPRVQLDDAFATRIYKYKVIPLAKYIFTIFFIRNSVKYDHISDFKIKHPVTNIFF